MDDDDDFGDFGGFEGADPNDNAAPPTGVEAGASPWAVFPPGIPQSQPDLLCARNTFPTYLDPAGITGGATNNNPAQHLELDPADFQRGDDSIDLERRNNQNDAADQARIAENVLDGTLGAGVPGLYLAAGRPPLRVDNPADICLNTDQARDNSRVLPDLGVGEGASLPDLGVGEGTSYLVSGINRNERSLELLPSVNQSSDSNVTNDLVNNVFPNDIQAHVASRSSVSATVEELSVNRVTESNDEELLSLRALNAKLEADLAKCQQDLEKQNQKLSEMETRHSTELVNLRQAGHDTLAVVVEQYKETTRTAILEQQEISTRYLQEKIKELTETFQQSFDTLNTEFNEKQDAQREAQEGRITEAVTASRQEQQERFDEFLEDERVKHREEIQKALESERESSQQKLEVAIQASQTAAACKMAEEQKRFTNNLEETEEEYKVKIKSALKEEQEKLEENLKESLKQEAERCRVSMETVVQQAREDSQEFINEQRQMDSRVRRRHLASLDLFLESARQQIQLLQETENEHSSPSSSSATEQDKKS